MKITTLIVLMGVTIICILTYIFSKDVLFNVLITIASIALVIGLYIQNKEKPEEQQSDLKKFEINEDDSKQCPVCNSKNNINRTYCVQCNTYIKNIVCPVCETKNPFDQKYCIECDSILQNKTRY